jgi:hypothetical protein
MDKDTVHKFSPTKKTTYLDDAVRQNAFLPAPGTYNSIDLDKQHDQKRRSNLSKSVKLSYLGMIQKEEIKKALPAPGFYDNK